MNVGFIGLGNIGAPMALNVVKAGHRTTVHDIRPAAAADLLEAGGDPTARSEASRRSAASHTSVVSTARSIRNAATRNNVI